MAPLPPGRGTFFLWDSLHLAYLPNVAAAAAQLSIGDEAGQIPSFFLNWKGIRAENFYS